MKRKIRKHTTSENIKTIKENKLSETNAKEKGSLWISRREI